MRARTGPQEKEAHLTKARPAKDHDRTVQMISRRTFLAAACAALPAAGAKRRFPGALGLAIYSLRGDAEKDLPGTLATIRKLGFKEVEVGGLFGRSTAEFRRLLDGNGLKATSMSADYPQLRDAIGRVAEDAHVLGAEYVVCSTVPHKQKHLTAEDCKRAADDLTGFGEKLLASKLHCCYHTHGIEFDKSPDGTLFDGLVKQTNPKFVNFEMDICWVFYGRQDPAAMLHRYPGRFPLMHVKDLRKGVPLGGSPGDVNEEDSVVFGKGVVDIAAALRAGVATGVRHYYLEDEAVDASRQIPESLRYLESIGV
jgi:sugar phosphate isomerase/epimerase